MRTGEAKALPAKTAMRQNVEEPEDEPEDEEPEDADDDAQRGEGDTKIKPRGADEFLCTSCFLVLPLSQLAAGEKDRCRDCA